MCNGLCDLNSVSVSFTICWEGARSQKVNGNKITNKGGEWMTGDILIDVLKRFKVTSFVNKLWDNVRLLHFRSPKISIACDWPSSQLSVGVCQITESPRTRWECSVHTKMFDWVIGSYWSPLWSVYVGEIAECRGWPNLSCTSNVLLHIKCTSYDWT